MIKRASIKRICVATLVLFVLLIIYLFPSNDTLIKSHLTYKEQEEMSIFLIDNNNYLARSSIIKSSNDIILQCKDIIDTLTIDSDKSTYIRNGFKSIIPKNTKLKDIKLDDKTLILNFSKEFLEIDEYLEDTLYEAITYSILENNNINRIKILVENTPINELNNNLPEYFDKSIGINKIYDITNIKDTSKTTIYYLSKYDDYYYYVPVTKISNDYREGIEIIVKELKSTPIHQTNLISYLKASANMTNYEILENEVNLSFDNKLIANLNNEDILESVKYQLALSIRDTYGISEVNFVFPDTEIDKIIMK